MLFGSLLRYSIRSVSRADLIVTLTDFQGDSAFAEHESEKEEVGEPANSAAMEEEDMEDDTEHDSEDLDQDESDKIMDSTVAKFDEDDAEREDNDSDKEFRRNPKGKKSVTRKGRRTRSGKKRRSRKTKARKAKLRKLARKLRKYLRRKNRKNGKKTAASQKVHRVFPFDAIDSVLNLASIFVFPT